ncbi:ATP-binding protein [Kitasatospora sp. NPDC057965]|uniref:ATP-binding protein n=1 Tax=Kitasatospora sp. NPDC057965 TaxID=3346291 RepID=UPI0036DB3788
MRALNPPDCTTVRAELRALLHTAGWPPDTISDAELAFQELFVNAWQHGRSPAPGVLVSLLSSTLRVAVCDYCPLLHELHERGEPFGIRWGSATVDGTTVHLGDTTLATFLNLLELLRRASPK